MKKIAFGNTMINTLLIYMDSGIPTFYALLTSFHLNRLFCLSSTLFAIFLVFIVLFIF